MQAPRERLPWDRRYARDLTHAILEAAPDEEFILYAMEGFSQ